ncbi:DsbA family oxidoreductase [Ramlibacter sp. G-1-2-2]|uniref:DsbA family oxidoreductase n=1 Tax=Ramlibacter agri TaxID=2728837 RepID=A0A848H0A8_9BURK|nr:DsbA family oxidoreductase [Ramlibacter agri]NML42510.1 DsbA family oxidoreductase [Ramlibacter agri]
MSAPTTLSIDVSFDLICPWCLIGKRNLEAAITQLRSELPEVDVAVEWRSFPLIPDTPLGGVPYREFYIARLGSPQAVAMRQAQVRAAAEAAGLTLAFEKIETFPNTILAHRFVQFARQHQGADAASALVEDLFSRYFLQGQDIGDPLILREALQACGVETPGRPDALLRHDLPWLPQLSQESFGSTGQGVPYFVFCGAFAVAGAQPPALLLQAMRRTLA